jgi:hypothetical protein
MPEHTLCGRLRQAIPYGSSAPVRDWSFSISTGIRDMPSNDHLREAFYLGGTDFYVHFRDGMSATVDLLDLGIDLAQLRLETVRTPKLGTSLCFRTRRNLAVVIDSSAIRAIADRSSNAELELAVNRLIVGVTHPRWYAETVRELRSLLELPENWNSYNARRIRPVIVDAAINLLPSVARVGLPKPIVIPTVGGSVQLEWHTRGIDLELRFLDPSKLHVSFEDDLERHEEWEKDVNASNVQEISEVFSALAGRK